MNRDLEKRLKKAEERLAAGESERDGGLASYRAELSAQAAALGWTVDWDADDAPSLGTPADVRAYFFARLAARARRPPHEATDDAADDDAAAAPDQPTDMPESDRHEKR